MSDVDWEVFGPMEAALVCGVVTLAALACGHESGLPLLVTVGVGGLVWIGFGLSYAVRSHGRRRVRRREDRRALVFGLLGFGVPAAVTTAVWQAQSFDGLLFSTTAATFGAVALSVIPVAIFASHMVDSYLILPFVYGLFGPPIWEENDTQLSPKRRRRYAKLWIAHRGICEICVFVSLALLLSIVFVAIGNAVSHDNTLPQAVESLGGAGIAFGVLTYLGPRVRDSLTYVLAQSAGLGAWATGIDYFGERVEGFVVDVSVHPGIKLRQRNLEWRYVPLRLAFGLQELQDENGVRPDAGWCENAVRERDEARLAPPEPTPWTTAPRPSSRPVAPKP